jgi:hypothetical protein
MKFMSIVSGTLIKMRISVICVARKICGSESIVWKLISVNLCGHSASPEVIVTELSLSATASTFT